MLIHAKNTVFWLFDPISRPQDPARDNLEPLGWHTEVTHLDGTGLPQGLLVHLVFSIQVDLLDLLVHWIYWVHKI